MSFTACGLIQVRPELMCAIFHWLAKKYTPNLAACQWFLEQPTQVNAQSEGKPSARL
jgi:hypothetical protein